MLTMKFPHCDKPTWVKCGAFCRIEGDAESVFKILVLGTNAAILETAEGKVYDWVSFAKLTPIA